MIEKLRYLNGLLHLSDGRVLKAVAGKGGVINADSKREGDGATPIGQFYCRELWFRPDRVNLPENLLFDQVHPIIEQDGWCDEPSHMDYNKPVKLPFAASHEQLWREDSAYDVMIPLGYNDAPAVAGKGSAIFFHLMHDDARPTEGCIAIARADMLALLPQLSPKTLMVIEG